MKNNRRASLFMLTIMLMSVLVQLTTAIGTIQAYAATGGRDITTLDGASSLDKDKYGNPTIITDVKMMIKNGSYLEEISESRPLKIGEIFEIQYKIDIPMTLSTEIEDQDYFDFKLPNSDDIKLIEDQKGPMIDPDNDEIFGEYHAKTNGDVRITFNDQVKGLEDVDGQLNFRVQLQQHTITIPGGHEIEVPYVSTTDGVFIYVQSIVDYYVLKEYIGREGNDLKWKILINPNYNHITDLELLDRVITSPKPDRITVDKMIAVDTDLQGNVTEKQEISIADSNVDMSTGKINLGFDEINEPYQLFVTTSFSELPNSAITNEVQIKGTIDGNGISLTSKATANVTDTPSIEKKVLEYDKNNQIVKWEVFFNANNSHISQEDAYFIDEITNGTVIRDSFKVNQNYPYNIDFSNDDTSFKFEFLSDLYSSVIITYDTKITDMNQEKIKNKVIYNGGVIEESQNTNGDDDGEDGDGESTIEKMVYSGNGTIAKWDLNINKERQKVDKWSVTDRVDSGSIRMDTFELFNVTTNSKVPESDYTIEWHDVNNKKAQGFTVNYDKQTNNNFMISYYTDIERNTNQSNHAYYYYFVDGEEKEDDDSKTTPSFALAMPYLTKSGRYIPESNEIEWTVSINDVISNNLKGIMGTEQVLTDPLLDNQNYVKDSADVYYSNYGRWDPNNSAKVNFNEELNQLEIRDFTDYATDTPQKVIFRTKLDNPFDIVGKKINNTAYYTDANTKNPLEAEASVTIGNANDLLLKKEGALVTGNPNLIDWKVEINPYGYTLNNLIIHDESWENQVVIRDTIQLKESITGKTLIEGSDYILDYTERYFTITMKNTVNQKLDLSYQGRISFPNGTPLGSQQQIKNSVRVTGDRIIQTEDPIEVEVTVQVPDSSGVIQGKTRDLNVKKVSADNPNETLEGAEFSLYRGEDKDPGKLVDRVTTGSNGIATFTKLTKGKYLLVETKAPNNYVISNEMKKGRIITISDEATTTVEEVVENPKTEGEDTVEFSVEKKWRHVPSGVSTPEVTVELYGNGKYVSEMTLNSGNQYKGTFTDLREKENGQLIEYTVDEVSIPGYETQVYGNVITNTYNKRIDFSGEKIWNDDNDKAEKRPDKITIKLFQDGEFLKDTDAYAFNGWKYTFDDLPEVNSETGDVYKYTVGEANVPEGYESVISGNNIINNFTEAETTSLKGKKIWNDNNNSAQKRPTNIKVQLFQDGNSYGDALKVSSSDNWEYEFTNLPKKNENTGKDYVYTVEETKVPEGYEAETQGNNIINTLETIEVVSLTGEKIWEDNNNSAQKRPNSVDIQLYQNDEPRTILTVEGKDGWKYQFTDLPKYDENHVAYNYRVEELNVPEGYHSSVYGSDIVNTYKEQEAETIEIRGTKHWEDNDNSLLTRPTFIKVELYQNNSRDPYRETFVYPDRDNNWNYVFEELPKFDEDGYEYEYTVKEDFQKELDYDSFQIGEYDLTNVFKNSEKIDISGKKIWDDDDDKDQLRPDEITVYLYADGEYVTSQDVTEGSGWKYSFTNLPKNTDDLEEIKYEVKEEPVPDYETSIIGTTITNTHQTDTSRINIRGEKIWEDNNNAQLTRPDEVEVRLMVGNSVQARTIASKESNWKYEFTDWPRYNSSGEEIIYTVREGSVANGYDSYVDGYDITNILTDDELIDIPGEKFWKDGAEDVENRPEEIEIVLQYWWPQGQTWYETDRQWIKPDANGYWRYVFKNQYKNNFDNNNNELFDQPREYRVVELDANGNAVEQGNQTTDGYIVDYDGTDLTNTKVINKVSVGVEKQWIEPGGNESLRPEEINVSLLRDGRVIDSQTLSNSEDEDTWPWSYTWTELDERDPKTYKKYEYSIREVTVPNYESEVYLSGEDEEGQEFVITNTFAPTETVNVAGQKYWDDKGFEEHRPDKITIDLLQDGKKIKSVETDESKKWAYEFKKLDKYNSATGKIFEYSVKESGQIADYDSTIAGYDISNKYKNDAKVSVSGEKIWDDYDNKFLKRPGTIDVHLYQGSKHVATQTISEGNDWKYSFVDLTKFNDVGVEYVYTVKEDLGSSVYTSSISGNDITNTYRNKETTTISGQKYWDDWDDNSNGFNTRPTQIDVELIQNTTSIRSQTVKPDKKGDWKYSFKDVPLYDENGNDYTYSVKETVVPDDYTVTVNGYDIYNKYNNTDTTDISVLKEWDDKDNEFDFRPESINVDLYRNGSKVNGTTIALSDKNNWAHTYTQLEKYDNNGNQYVYTVAEEGIEDYATTYETKNNVVTITNKLNDDKLFTNISGLKIWDDYNNKFETRPQSITVVLVQNGVEIADKIQTVDASDGWQYEFTNLLKNDENGEPYKYTVKEKDVPEEYESSTSGTNIINKYRNTDTIDIIGEKKWDDYNNKFETRPESIKINLIRDDSIIQTIDAEQKDNYAFSFKNLAKYDETGEEYEYDVSEVVSAPYTSEVTAAQIGNTINAEVTNTYKNTETVNFSGEKIWNDYDGKLSTRPTVTIQLIKTIGTEEEIVKSQLVNETNNWHYEFKEQPKYDDEGNEIQYSVKEVLGLDEFGYIPSQQGDDFVNTYVNTETVTFNGVKVWDDYNDYFNTRPNEVTIYLLEGDSVIETTTTNASSKWEYSFNKGYPVYDETGDKYSYRILEKDVQGYTSVIEADGTTITNKYVNTTTTKIEGSKTWDDFNNNLDTRPTSITVELVRDGVNTGKTQVVSKETDWKYSFDDLLVYDESDRSEPPRQYVYTIIEHEVDGYTQTQAGPDFVNKSEKVDEKTSLFGEKVWQDANNILATRPTSVTVVLYQNGQKMKDENNKEITQEVNLSTNWKYRFDNLPKYDNEGKEYVYTVQEKAVPDYEVTYFSNSNSEMTIINTYINNEKINLNGVKTWDDSNNKVESRPESIFVELYEKGNDTPIETKEVEPDKNGNWVYEFTGLPKFNDDLIEIEYSIKEQKVPHYDSNVNGMTIHNTYLNDEVTEISGEKIWLDEDDKLSKRPESIEINLYQNDSDTPFRTQTIEADDVGNWSYNFKNLPKYDDSLDEYEYRVEEVAVPNYESDVSNEDGTTITNRLINNDKTSLKVIKHWNDEDDKLNTRPNSIWVNLYRNNNKIPYKTQKISTDLRGNWEHEFTDLPKYDSKLNPYVYVAKEVRVPNYQTETETDSLLHTTTITNTYLNNDLTEVHGTKAWMGDFDNKLGSRPESITVELFRIDPSDPEKQAVYQDSTTVSADEEGYWSYSFTGLTKYNESLDEYQYIVKEQPVDHYETEIDGATIINTYQNTDKISLNGEKTWIDFDDKLEQRPKSIEIDLYQNDDWLETKTVEADKNGNWTYEFVDLAKYDSSLNEYQYSIKERDVTGYKTEIDGMNITNYYQNDEKTLLVGKKVWDDESNKLNKRPATIRVDLYQNNGEKPFRTQLVKANGFNEWSYMFTDLPKYDDKLVEYDYTVKERPIVNYNSDVSGTTITNTYNNVDVIGLKGEKIWDDKDNKLNSRPKTIYIDLYQDDSTDVFATEVVEADENGNWVYEFVDLPKYNAELDEYEYRIKERTVPHYESKIDGNNIVNTYQNTDMTSVKGSKTWDDEDNKLGTRPESIFVMLYQTTKDNPEVAENQSPFRISEIKATDDWKYEFTDLPKYDDNLDEYQYVVKEHKVIGYEETITGNDIHNVYQNTEVTKVTGTKTWVDQGNIINSRPETITVNLYQSGLDEVFRTQIVTPDVDGNWVYEFIDLPKYDEKLNEYTYTVKEEAVSHYETKVTGFDLTNTYLNTDLTSLQGEKIWDDENNRLETRPESIQIDLYQNGGSEVFRKQTVKPDVDGNWTYEFVDLPKYDDDLVLYRYSVSEQVVPNYTTSIAGTTITNKYINDKKTELHGEKKWSDKEDKLKVRPTEIKVDLYQNNIKLTEKTQTVTSDDKGNWNYSFTDLPMYDEKLIAYSYTVKEQEVSHYDSEVSGTTITNTYRNDDETEVSGEKLWVDKDNKINSRPESITVELYQNQGQEPFKTQVVKADDKGNWQYTFSQLPKYDSNYDLFEYTVKEVNVPHYESEIKGTTITNTYQNTDLISVDGQKQWNDYDDKLKQRPESIVVELYQNDGETPFKVQEVKAGENNDWSYSFKELPKYDDELNEYKYTVKEREVSDYQTTIEGTTIINTFKNVETIKVEGQKIWEDLDDKLQVRPTSIMIDLYQNDEKIPFRTQEVTADTDGNWSYEFNDLPKYDNSLDEITYKVKEQEVPHYNSQIDGTTITNTYRNDDQTSVKGEKIWQDKDNKLSSRPKTITIDLYQNDSKSVYQTVDVKADKDGNWSYEFNNLPKYDNELNEFAYTVKEQEVPHYESQVADMTITNTYRNDDTTIIEGEKIWQDEDNKLNLRPKAITVELYQNDDSEPFKMKRVTPDSEGNWHYDFKDLPKYDEELNEFIYTMKEQDVYHYESQVDGASITNTYRNDDLTSLNGEKKWKDQDDKLKVRPQSITVELYQNNGEKPYQTKEVTPDSDGDWFYEFKDLPKYDDKLNEFNYTVKEVVVDHYDSQVKGINITNTYRNDDVTTVAGQKQWNDYEDKLKQRPESIVVELYQNNSQTPMKTQEVKAGENNAWRYEFTDLRKYDTDLNEYHYTVKEQEVTDYQTTIEGTTIINTFKNVETIKVSGEKQWDDLDNKLNSRPEFIIVDLYQNEDKEAYRSQKVIPNEEGDWDYEFNDLPKYDTELTAIAYTVKEQAVTHYDSKIEGTTITNTYRNDETTTIAGEKTWQDENDKLRLRPDSITVELYQNKDEKAYQSLVVKPTNEGYWNYEFKDLPKYDEELNEITYTVKEKEVTYYDSQVEGTNITNTYRNDEVTSITGQKLWQDDDNKGETRPSAITVEIYQNESKEPFKSQKVTPDKNGNWNFTFDDLPKYDKQLNTYTYTVDEVSVKGYSTKVEGTTITNTLNKEPVNPKEEPKDTTKNKSYLPKTGEDNHEGFLASLLGVTLVSMIAGVVVLRKRYYN